MPKRKENKKKRADLKSPLSDWKSNLTGEYSESVGDFDSNFDCTSVHSFTSLPNDINELEDFNFSSENLSVDGLEAKLIEYLDKANEKNSKIRTESLKKIKIILSNKIICSFVINRRDTFVDTIKKCLKKGKGDEQENAALLSSIIFIILGCTNDCDVVYEFLKPILITYLNDKSVDTSCREYCALALSVGCFIAPSGVDHLQKIMEILYNIFSNSFPNGEGVYPTLSLQVSSLHNAALNGWSLLLTVLSSSKILKIAKTFLPEISSLLNSNDQELRLSAGETISLIHELAREANLDFEYDKIDQLSVQLKELATYSLKFRSKKNRKTERSNFRDIIRTVIDYEPPSFIIKRREEIIELNNWSKKIQYDIFCQILESGIVYHLGENQLVRDVLDLGPIPLEDQVANQRTIKKYGNNEADKIRSKIMRKLKGKRYDCY